MGTMKRIILSTLLLVVHHISAFQANLRPQPLVRITPSLRRKLSFTALSVSVSINPDLLANEQKVDKHQGLTSACFGLIKACVGSGVLTLPYGLAVMSDLPTIAYPATALLMLLAIFSGYTFGLVGRICHANGAKTVGEAWELEIGKKSSWVVDFCTFVYTMGCTMSFSIVLGDFISALAKGAGMTGLMTSRKASILAITLSSLYPLSMMDSLASLAPVSIAGVFGVALTGLFMMLQCLSSAYKLPHGKFLPTVPLLPSFGQQTEPFNPLSSLILGSMLANAFLAHFSAPDFIFSLKQDDSVLRKFGILTALGFGCTAVISTIIMVSGFLTFGGNTAGVILNNYSTFDAGAAMCRLLSVLSIVGAFPFLLQPGQKALTNLLFKGKELSRSFQKFLTTVLVTLPTIGALLTTNAGLIVSFNGALMGSAIIYIFPSMLFLADRSRGTKMERLANRFLIGFGVFAAAIGGTASLLKAFAPHMLTG